MLGGKRMRELADLTLHDVATEMGVSVNTVWRWENGKVDPGTERLKKLACLYGCTTDNLLDSPEPSLGDQIREKHRELAAFI